MSVGELSNNQGSSLLQSTNLRGYGAVELLTGDDVEKNADSPERSSKMDNPPDKVDTRQRKSDNCFKNLLNAPCGESPVGKNYITIALSGLLLWALLFAFLEHDAEPGGQLFLLIVLTLLSYFSGWIVSLLHLPPLLGMLVCGIFLRNIKFFDVTGVYADIVIKIREVALTTILLKAGLGLDPGALKKLSLVVARLAFTPCLAETIGAAAAAHYILQMPWLWGLLLGSVLSAVSPAVVVPTLLILKEKGYGEKKGISTLVIAASSIDDIISISMFGVILGMIFTEDASDGLAHKLLQGPIEVGIGLVAGIGWGFVAACFPHRNEDHLIVKRSFIVGGGGLVAVLLSTHYGYAGSGPLAAIILSFIGQLCWKWQGWSKTYNPVADVINSFWGVMQPLLFGLIGTEIRLETIQLSLLLQGMAVLAFGLFVRVISCCIVLVGAKLNMKEVIFVNLAWLPKATVQATLGPIALDSALRFGEKMENMVPHARNILTIAVLSILVTAPIGAIGISLGGPRLLSNEPIPPPLKEYRYTENDDRKPNVAVVEDQL